MATQSFVRQIIVHYTATYEDDTTIDRDVVDRWHKDRGWSGIGYHFLIRQDGTVQRGRPVDTVGAHAPPNTGRVGVCYVGGLRRETGQNVGVDTRTPAQTEALIKIITDLKAGVYNTSIVTVSPDADVLGHRDVGSTQCPGFDVAKWWKAVADGKRPRPQRPPADTSNLPPVRTPDVREDPEPPKAPAPVTGTDVAAGGGFLAAIGAAVATGARWAIVAALVIGAGYVVFKMLNDRRK
jgi:N-acetylmuramoyl-L-alanine amidase